MCFRRLLSFVSLVFMLKRDLDASPIINFLIFLTHASLWILGICNYTFNKYIRIFIYFFVFLFNLDAMCDVWIMNRVWIEHFEHLNINIASYTSCCLQLDCKNLIPIYEMCHFWKRKRERKFSNRFPLTLTSSVSGQATDSPVPWLKPLVELMLTLKTNSMAS